MTGSFCAFLLTLATAASAVAAPPPPSDSDAAPFDPSRGVLSDYQMPNDWEAAADAAAMEFAPTDDCRHVDVPAQVAPVVRGERLIGYAFVVPRLCLARGVSEDRIREQLHFVVDRMVRAAHATPFTLDEDGDPDNAATAAAWTVELGELLGEEALSDLRLLGGDLRLLQR